MTKFSQAPHAVMMVRPASFGFNPQTAESNAFQKADEADPSEVSAQAIAEFDRMVETVSAYEIALEVFDDPSDIKKTDAVFPNNWISFHEDGTVVLYPLQAENRRHERRVDILEHLQTLYEVKEIVDLTEHEAQGKFLEGTGSIVFDHVNRIAFASRSSRTDVPLFQQLCRHLKYAPIVFHAVDEANKPVYHTNVVLSVGTQFAVICLDAIPDDNEQEILLGKFSSTGHKVIAISYEQMHAFAGNILEVQMKSGDAGVLISKTAFDTLLPGQIDAISRFAELIPIDVPTIEKYGGGSVRCMVAGIHLMRTK